MKILHISFSDCIGGAAKACFRLHSALVSSGVDSKILVQRKVYKDTNVIALENYRFDKFMAKARGALHSKLKMQIYKSNDKKYIFSEGSFFSRALRKIEEIDPDIVHIHWVSRYILKVEDIAKIKRPIVYTLHDMWPMTGGCHYSLDCKQYENGCGHCPALRFPGSKDLSYKNFNKKNKAYAKIDNMKVVGVSNWIANCARQSSLLSKFDVYTIPNPLDMKVFQPMDKYQAREILGIDQNKKIILFGCDQGIKNPLKGSDLLFKSLVNFSKYNKETLSGYQLVVFGSDEPKHKLDIDMSVRFLGRIQNEQKMSVLYNAADALVMPSLADNLPQVAVESLACGTPVVAFNVGGVSDIVDHKKNGYLAKPYDTFDFYNGIQWILNGSHYSGISISAAEKAKSKFSSDILLDKYIVLYKSLLLGA